MRAWRAKGECGGGEGTLGVLEGTSHLCACLPACSPISPLLLLAFAPPALFPRRERPPRSPSLPPATTSARPTHTRSRVSGPNVQTCGRSDVNCQRFLSSCFHHLSTSSGHDRDRLSVEDDVFRRQDSAFATMVSRAKPGDWLAVLAESPAGVAGPSASLTFFHCCFWRCVGDSPSPLTHRAAPSL